MRRSEGWCGPAAAAAFLALTFFALTFCGCGKFFSSKSLSRSPDKAEVRAVTSEIVAAIQKIAGRDAQVTIRQVASAHDVDIPAPGTDDISVFVSSDAQAEALRKPLAQIARKHKLAMAWASPSEGELRFDFSSVGTPTQSVLVKYPIAAHDVPVAHSTQKGPKLAIILDDVGNDQQAADSLLALPFPLTLSILPHLPLSTEIADEAARRGDEVMLHLPMQSESDATPAETIELRVGMPGSEVPSVLKGMLETVPHAAGVNNHEGSKATSDPQLMDALMPALRTHGLFFIDSRTTASTVAFDAAEHYGVRAASRKVFLDDSLAAAAIRGQVELAARDARANGDAIAIGHPHPETIAVLREELPRLKQEGIQLVFASDLVH